MRVVVIHPSGARYEGPQRYAEQWWGRFEGPATTLPVGDAEEAPKVVGVDGGWSGAQQRSYESEAAFSYDVPVVNASAGEPQVSPAKVPPFGFVRNEENE